MQKAKSKAEKGEINSKIKGTPIGEDFANLEYYDYVFHRHMILGFIIGWFIIILVIIPGFIGLFQWIDSSIWQGFNGGNTENPSIIPGFPDLLPDFFGGMVGILIGFLMEWTLFSKLKTLDKYESLLLALEKELHNIYKIVADTDDEKDYGIRIIITDDIVLNANNSEVFFSLPRFTLSKRKGLIYSLLVRIYSGAVNYNAEIDAYRELEKAEEMLKWQLKYIESNFPNDVTEKEMLKNRERALAGEKEKNENERTQYKQELKKNVEAFLLATTGKEPPQLSASSKNKEAAVDKKTEEDNINE